MDNFKILESAISSQRLKTYMQIAGNNKEKSVELYRYNIAISEKLHTALIQCEVMLRNSINNILINRYGNEWYLDYGLLVDSKHQSVLSKLKKTLIQEGKYINNANIISNLNLGFWVYLFNKEYDLTLWRKDLYKIFPEKRISRNLVRQMLHKMKKLRNRIAHCECILRYKPLEYYEEILEFMSWIDSDFTEWFSQNVKA